MKPELFEEDARYQHMYGMVKWFAFVYFFAEEIGTTEEVENIHTLSFSNNHNRKSTQWEVKVRYSEDDLTFSV